MSPERSENILSGVSAQNIRKKVFSKLKKMGLITGNGNDMLPIDTVIYTKGNMVLPSTFGKLNNTNEPIYVLGTKTRKDATVVGLLIGIIPYGNDKHSQHLVSAFKYGTSLFCFDPWGGNRLPVSTKVFQALATVYGATQLHYYNGVDLQKSNLVGMCAAWSSEYLARVIGTYYAGKLDFVKPMAPPSNVNTVNQLTNQMNRLAITNKLSKAIAMSLQNPKFNTLFTRTRNEAHFKEFLNQVVPTAKSRTTAKLRVKRKITKSKKTKKV
jgi:hypothetical protein